MNKQGKKGIEWCDYTWNPITGCKYGCKFCYAEKLAKRFKADINTFTKSTKLSYTNDFQCYEGIYLCPFPFGFNPTFYKNRLNEPMKLKNPSNIFVVSMGDLFGDWWEIDTICKIFQTCFDADWHTYMFLTKNPRRYDHVISNICGEERYFDIPILKNIWVGTTITCQGDVSRIDMMNFREGHKFVSIEPLLGPIEIPMIKRLEWCIVGQQTNPAKPPKYEWVQSVINQCRTAGVPVFVKSPLYERFPIQEWPEGLKR
jgi:protein gp37